MMEYEAIKKVFEREAGLAKVEEIVAGEQQILTLSCVAKSDDVQDSAAAFLTIALETGTYFTFNTYRGSGETSYTLQLLAYRPAPVAKTELGKALERIAELEKQLDGYLAE
jgi:hypothetical protein